jgi:TorA maturation chaperone TorD
MTPEETLVARAAAYELLARIFRGGLTPELLALMQGLPGIADVLPESVDVEAQAADHYRLFGLEVFPFASAYLEADGRLGGATTDMVARLMLEAGLEALGSESPDHISSELDALAHLCRIQAASAPGSAAAGQAVELQRRLLVHLVWWLPVFCHAVELEGNTMYGGAAAWIMDLVVDHHQVMPTEEIGDTDWTLPDSPNILQDESTGLRRLADFLSHPALSGIVLSRSRIESMARDLGVPRGFGDRALMLGNLMSAAGTYDRTHHLIDRLAAFAEEWRAYFAALEGPNRPMQIVAAAGVWRGRAEHTLAMLSEMSRALSGEDSSEF